MGWSSRLSEKHISCSREKVGLSIKKMLRVICIQLAFKAIRLNELSSKTMKTGPILTFGGEEMTRKGNWDEGNLGKVYVVHDERREFFQKDQVVNCTKFCLGIKYRKNRDVAIDLATQWSCGFKIYILKKIRKRKEKRKQAFVRKAGLMNWTEERIWGKELQYQL